METPVERRYGVVEGPARQPDEHCDVVLVWVKGDLLPEVRASLGPHLGLGYLQAFLGRRGVRSRQYLPPAGHRTADAARDILSYRPEVVGFTCYDRDYQYVKTLAAAVRATEPRVMIVAGGATATSSWRFLLEDCADVDVCVRGDGEDALLAILERGAGAAGSLHDVCGLAFRERGAIVASSAPPPGRAPGGLDRFPSPWLEGVFGLDVRPGLVTSRGCPYRCTYCGAGRRSGRSLRYHSVERVLEEFDLLQPAEGDLQIHDCVFAWSTPRTRRLFRALAERGNRRPFSCQARADRVDEELLGGMARAGLEGVNFGLESSVPHVLRAIRKLPGERSGAEGLSAEEGYPARVRDAVEIAQKHGIDATVSIITGLPGETLEDALATRSFAESLPVASYSHNLLKVYPGTDLHDDPGRTGVRVRPSMFGLPLIARPAFDPCRVELGERSVQREEDERLGLLLREMHTGRMRARLPSSIWVRGALPPVEPGLFELGSPVLSSLPPEELGAALRSIRAAVSAGAPTDKFFLLIEDGASGRVDGVRFLDEVEWTEEVPVGKPRVELPIRSLREFAESPAADAGGAILSLRSEEDVTELRSLLDAGGESELGRRMLAERAGLENECRWIPSGCTLACHRRLHVGDGGEVSPCAPAPGFASTGASREEVEDRIAKLRAEELRRRGCVACPVEDSCAKCLFPAPLEVSEYCRLRRRAPAVPRFFGRLFLERLASDLSG